MFVSFSLLAFVGWVVLSSLLPGAILSFSIFRKQDFSFIEKLFIGFALGVILLPLVPFILYLVAGIKYSYSLALLSVGVLYATALAFFVKNKAYEDVLALAKKEGGKADAARITISRSTVLQLVLAFILILTYLVRIGSYSPIFMELDPYYYTYTAQQLLIGGENPFDDRTAWYPEVVVNHRIIPEISYLEAGWYSFYSGGAGYDNMLLAVIASMYPPIAAVLSVFSIYLLVATVSKREWGVVAAGIAAFSPLFIYKLSAGEQEVQPYAFFALFFFYAMYALALRKEGLHFPVLAGIAFAALALGSGSQIVALLSVVLFIVAQAVLYFLRDGDTSTLRRLLVSNAIVFVLGPVIGSMLLKDVFSNGAPSLSIMVPYLLALAFAGALYAIKERVSDKSISSLALGAMLLVALLVYAFTPVGTYVKGIGQSAFGIVKYNAPLDRTIAEQGVASDVFGNQVGFVAEVYNDVAATILIPITAPLKASSPALADSLNSALGNVLSLIFAVFSLLANIGLAIFVGLVNLTLGSDVSYTQKANSFMLFWIFAFWVALAWCGWRFMKKEDESLFMLFAAMVMPPFVVGLIKAKYTIYAGVLLAVAIGFVLAAADNAVRGPLRKFLKGDEHGARAASVLLVLGALLVLLQFAYQGFTPSLIWSSLQTLYQNDPQALAPKFQQFCDAYHDSDVCAAAADPMGYASTGTNYQYSYKLCLLSVFSNYSYIQNQGQPPSWELIAAQFRCGRISDYWMKSMEWLRNNTEGRARVTSWWDYGHWINFFGQRNAVLRNEHASSAMIGEVAHDYIDGSPEELRDWMNAHDSKYALFDMELVSGGSELGGKYGALNYLSCARDNETDVSKAPGESQCEADHLWETVLVSQMPCTISKLTNKSGVTAYRMYSGQAFLPSYPSICEDPKEANYIAYCKNYVRLEPVYCVGETTLATGAKTYATYYLNETYANGDLRLNKAMLQQARQVQTSHLGPVVEVTLFYTEDAVWLENGEVKSGYEDRKGKFYDSNIYRALFLNNIPGFRLVYSTPDQAVKIYEVEG